MGGVERSRLPFAALGFAIAAALSSWNPLSAPFGLVVGLAALVLAFRALGGAGRRGAAIGALVVSSGAILASALVLALTAGVGRELGGTPVVPVPARSDVESELGAAAQRTRGARERASKELETLGEPPNGAGGDRQERRPAGRPPGSDR